MLLRAIKKAFRWVWKRWHTHIPNVVQSYEKDGWIWAPCAECGELLMIARVGDGRMAEDF